MADPYSYVLVVSSPEVGTDTLAVGLLLFDTRHRDWISCYVALTGICQNAAAGLHVWTTLNNVYSPERGASVCPFDGEATYIYDALTKYAPKKVAWRAPRTSPESATTEQKTFSKLSHVRVSAICSHHIYRLSSWRRFRLWPIWVQQDESKTRYKVYSSSRSVTPTGRKICSFRSERYSNFGD